MVQIHITILAGRNTSRGTVRDCVVAAGDGGEDPCLDVHHTITAARSVRAELQKTVDMADMSVQFSSGNANFWAMHAGTASTVRRCYHYCMY